MKSTTIGLVLFGGKVKDKGQSVALEDFTFDLAFVLLEYYIIHLVASWRSLFSLPKGVYGRNLGEEEHNLQLSTLNSINETLESLFSRLIQFQFFSSFGHHCTHCGHW